MLRPVQRKNRLRNIIIRTGVDLMKIKFLLTDLSFLLGHKLIVLSVRIMGYHDKAAELKEARAHWMKNDDFI